MTQPEARRTADAPVTSPANTGTIVRDCILCGASAHEPVFVYTFDFLVNVRGQSAEKLRRTGWTEDVTSTIVRCEACGCHYVRDVRLPSSQYAAARSEWSESDEAIAEFAKEMLAQDTFKSYPNRDAENWTVRTLVMLAAKAQQRDIRFLDFGAGGGQASSMARACGVRDVVAYDPFFVSAAQKRYDAANFAGILCVRDKPTLMTLGPFDAAIFQSAVEHVADPRGELATIFELLSPGGYLYVNNPVMDLNKKIGALRAARKIVKRDRISHYHPGHLNYLLPNEFAALLREVGFRITPMVLYPPVPMAPGFLGARLKQNAKSAVRWLQNTLGLPYTRYAYVVQKP